MNRPVVHHTPDLAGGRYVIHQGAGASHSITCGATGRVEYSGKRRRVTCPACVEILDRTAAGLPAVADRPAEVEPAPLWGSTLAAGHMREPPRSRRGKTRD